MIQAEGAERLERLGQELKTLGDKQFRSEIYRGLSRAVKPLREIAKRTPHLIPGLPKRGGLADTVAKGLRGRGGIKTRRALTGRNVGITISATSSGHEIRAMERGRLRHPVFGRQRRAGGKVRGIWVNQQVTPGFWSKPMTEKAPQAREEITREIDSAFKRIRG